MNDSKGRRISNDVGELEGSKPGPSCGTRKGRKEHGDENLSTASPPANLGYLEWEPFFKYMMPISISFSLRMSVKYNRGCFHKILKWQRVLVSVHWRTKRAAILLYGIRGCRSRCLQGPGRSYKCARLACWAPRARGKCPLHVLAPWDKGLGEVRSQWPRFSQFPRKTKILGFVGFFYIF